MGHHRAIGQIGYVFDNGPGDRGSILGRVISKIQKMVLDADFLNGQRYKVRIKGKLDQSREWSKCLSLHVGVVAIEKEPSGRPRQRSSTLLYKEIRTSSYNDSPGNKPKLHLMVRLHSWCLWESLLLPT